MKTRFFCLMSTLFFLIAGSSASFADPMVPAATSLLKRAQCESLPQKTSEDLWNVAQCFYETREFKQAVNALREVVRKNPSDVDAYFVSSWLIWSDGNARGGEEERRKTEEALQELLKARLSFGSHWSVDTEIGDFYALRMNSPSSAYAEYIKARNHYEGDFTRSIPKATEGRKASIENRIARTTEQLGRKGEAVEASCRALFFDPDDSEAKRRIDRLSGSCERQKVKDPRSEVETEAEAVAESVKN